MPNATIEQILGLLGQANKTASNMASEHVPPTAHPVGKLDDGTQAPPTDSERLKQQDAYMRQQTPAPVESATPPSLSAEATSPQLGVEQGTADSNELATLSDVTQSVDDPGTSHPAKAASLSDGQLAKTAAALIESLDTDLTFSIAATKNDLLRGQTNQTTKAAATAPATAPAATPTTAATPHSQASLSDNKVAAQAEVDFVTKIVSYAEEQAIKTALYLIQTKQAEEAEQAEEEEESEEGEEHSEPAAKGESQTPPPAANNVEVPPEMLEGGAPPMPEAAGAPPEPGMMGGDMPAGGDMGGAVGGDMGGMPGGGGMPSEEELMALLALLEQEGIDPSQLGMMAQEKAAAKNAAFQARRATLLASRLTALSNKTAAAKAATPGGKKAAQSARRYLDELLQNVVN